METANQPSRVNRLLYHYRQQAIRLAAIWGVVLVCRWMDISRQTFYRWKRDLPDGQGHHSSAPHRHGRATPEATELLVIGMKAEHPNWGKRRISQELFDKHGVSISPNTVQKIVLKYNQPKGKSRPKKKRMWNRFEAIAPHVIWQMDICYLYSDAKTGETIYLIAILDDHSRYCLAARLCRTQDTQDVLDVLHQAVTHWGCPEVLLLDHGVQFVNADFIRVCCGLGIEPCWCGKGHPQTKGKIERFFETLQEDHSRLTPFAELTWNQTQLDGWIHYYNTQRVHDSVQDSQGHSHPPLFRMGYRLGRPIPECLIQAESFWRCCLEEEGGSNTRVVSAKGTIRYRGQTYSLPSIARGSRVHLSRNGRTLFVKVQGQLVATFELPATPAKPKGAMVRLVKANGTIKFQHTWQKVNAPAGSQVVLAWDGNEVVVKHEGKIVNRFDYTRCNQPI